MNELTQNQLEIISGGDSSYWDALITCGALSVGALAYLATAPASVTCTLMAVGAYNFGLIGSCVSISSILSK